MTLPVFTDQSNRTTPPSKMSFGIGIGDILFCVDQSLTLYGKCRGAPAELQAASRDVEHTRLKVKILGDAVGDKSSFVAKHDDV